MKNSLNQFFTFITQIGVFNTTPKSLIKIIKLTNAVAISILIVHLMQLLLIQERYNTVTSFTRLGISLIAPLIVLVLNKNGRYLIARYLLAISFAFIMFLRCSKFENATGEYFYYFPMIILSLLTFEAETKLKFILGLLIPISTILIIETLDWTQLSELTNYSTDFVLQARLVNMTLSLVGTSINLYYYIALNKQQEQQDNQLLVFELQKQKIELETVNNHLLEKITAQNLELTQHQDRLIQAKKYGKLGAWSLDVVNNTITWDDQVFLSFEMDVSLDTVPPLEEYYSLLHQDDVVVLQQHVAQAIFSKTEFSCRLRQKQLKSNTYRWFLAKGKCKLDQEGNVVSLEGINIDINDLILTENKLLDSENALEQLLENAAVGIVLIHKGMVIYTNEAMKEMIGYENVELKGLNVETIIQPEHLDVVNNLFFTKNTHQNIDIILIKSDGNYLDVSISCKAIMYKGKSVLCATVIDISARKLYEKELITREQESRTIQNTLKQQNELFENLYDNIPVILILVNSKGEILRLNKHFSKVLGYKENEVFNLTQVFQSELPELGLYWKEVELLDKKQQKKITNWVQIRLSNGLNLLMGEDITQEIIDQQKIEHSIIELQQLNHTLAKNEEYLQKSNVALYEKNKLLDESEYKAKVLSEATFEAVLLVQNGVTIEANNTAIQLLECDIDELKSIQLFNLVVPSQRAYFNQLVTEEVNEPTEITFVTKLGKLFYGEIRSRSFQFQLQEIKIITIRDITERIQKEKLLQESESNIRQVFDSLPIGLFLGQSTQVLLYNVTLLELLELDKDYKGQLSFNDFVHTEYKGVFDTFLIAKTDKSNNNVDIQLITAKGNHKFVNLSKSFVRYRHQYTLIITCLDISERKKTEDHLKRSYAYQYSILNTGKIGYWATDLDNKILFCNEYHQMMMKNTFGKVMEIGKSVIDFLPNQDFIDDYLNLCQLVISTGEGVVSTKEITEINGTVHFGEYYLSPIFEEGVISGILVRARDITESILVSKNIYESEERLRESQKIAKIGCWEFDIKTAKIIWSDEMYVIHDLETSYTPSFESNYLLLGKENQEYLDRLAHQAILTGNKWKHECFITTEKGANKWVRIIGIPVYDQNNNLVKLRGTTQDITDNKITELKVQENEELLEAIIENLPVAFQMYDNVGYSLRMNHVQRKFLGIEANNLNAIYNIFNDEEHYSQDLRAKLVLAFKGEKLRFDRLKLATKNHENEPIQKYFDAVFLPVFDYARNLKTVIYLGIDVSEGVHKEKELELKHQELIETTKKIAEYRMMALRSVMNPHFLFNSLNSIQYFIAKNERELALTYLSLFSKLVRKILESSITIKISLTDELSILKYYVELENLRFDNKFAVIFDISAELNTDEVEVPSLVLQPYVENSVIHGLLNKDRGQGVLKVKIIQKDDLLLCTIEDNGIGREAASGLKHGIDHKSIGMKVTEERLKIINKIDDVSVNIIDLYDEQGTPIGTRNDIVIRIIN